MRKIWIFIVRRLCGWRYNIPAQGERPEIHHCVFIMAPHTSIADYLLGTTCLWMMGVDSHILMKKEFFNWFTRPFLRYFGAIPVDRGNRDNNIVEQAVAQFNASDDFSLTITPEGTRKPVKRWKRGFYDIAVKANVPIILSYMDFKKKEMGIGPSFIPTGDFRRDLPEIMKFYEDIHAKHPENYIKHCDF